MKTSYQERDYTFGQVILTLRVAIGLTQGRLGSLLGVSARSVAGWEGGSNYPNTKHLKTLIELAVQHQAFPKDTAAEEIRRLWKAAGQKVLLDEDWLAALLSQQSYQSSAVEPEAVEEIRSCAPPSLPKGEAEPDREIQRTADSSGQAVGAAARPSPLPDENMNVEVTACPSPANRDRADPWHEAQGHNEALDQHEVLTNSNGNARFYMYKKLKMRKRLLLSLIALVILTIIGSAGMLFFHLRNGTTTQVNKTVTDQAYPGYLSGSGTLAFFDPLSQERGSQWKSSRLISSGGSCQFTDGAYHISQQQLDGGYYARCTADRMFSNFAFEVQLTITQGDCGGMLFRDEGNGHFYNFFLCEVGRFWVTKYVDNRGSDTIFLYTGWSSAIHTGLGQQNTIAVVASGSTMTFYANQHQIAQVQDSSYTSGLISLVADTPFGDPTEVVYRNAKLWTL